MDQFKFRDIPGITPINIQNQRDMEYWSPYDIKVLLHHYASSEAFEGRHYPAYKETIGRMTAAGVLQHVVEHDIYQATPLGCALVGLWCKTPLPIASYVDPRFEQQRVA